MPDLPTITVTQQQFDILVGVFGNAANYRDWLRRQLIAAVKDNRRAAVMASLDAQVSAAEQQVEQELGGI